MGGSHWYSPNGIVSGALVAFYFGDQTHKCYRHENFPRLCDVDNIYVSDHQNKKPLTDLTQYHSIFFNIHHHHLRQITKKHISTSEQKVQNMVMAFTTTLIIDMIYTIMI